MLTQKYRPSSFLDVVGQREAVSFLQRISLRPKTAPRVLLLHGPHGVGKTTLARVYARAGACELLSKKTPDVCGHCPACVSPPRYLEFDALDLYDSEILSRLRRVLTTSPERRLFIICDEVQIVDRSVQSSLLKAVEEVSPNVHIVMVTTDADSVIPTLRSRAVEVPVYPLSVSDIKNRLESIAAQEGLNLDEEAARSLAVCADGHMRDAVMMLHRYQLTGSYEFATLLSDLFSTFFLASAEEDVDTAKRVLSDAFSSPLSQVRRSLYAAVSEIVRCYVTRDKSSSFFPVASSYGSRVFKLLRFVSEPWFQSAFKDEHLAMSAMWTLHTACYGKRTRERTQEDVHAGEGG